MAIYGSSGRVCVQRGNRIWNLAVDVMCTLNL